MTQNIIEAYKDMQLNEGKYEAQQLKKLLGMTKSMMKEVDTLYKKGEDKYDIIDQITGMNQSLVKLRDSILRASKVNPK
jgi:hypothetical protein